MYSSSRTMLTTAANRFENRTALVSGDARINYSQLNAAAQEIASGLLAAGLTPGERVTIFSENRWEWVAAYHGILAADLVVNPVNAMLTEPELMTIVTDCKAAAIIGSAACLARVEGALSGPSLRLVVSLDGDADDVVGLDRLRTPARRLDPSTEPNDLVSISYTSGTTGTPKGAMQSQQSLLLNWAYTATMHVRTESDVVISALPLMHVYGNCAVNSTLMAGGCVVLEQRFDPDRVLGLVSEHEATIVEGVPTMYAMMVDRLKQGTDADVSSLTRCTVGGQTIASSVVTAWEKATAAPLLELWGMTELSGLGTTHSPYASPQPGSIGVSFPSLEIRVCSFDDTSQDAPEGEEGELVVRGPLVTLGYFNNEAATAKLIEPDGWMHTGDVATRTGSHFFVVDRRSDMILTGGFNIYPAELERVLSGHPDVALVGVGRAHDDRLGEVPHAYVIAAAGRTPDPEGILAWARGQLAPYKLPRAIFVVDDLPKTTSGKIKRRELTRPNPQKDLIS